MTENKDGVQWANAIRKLCGNQCLRCGTDRFVEAHHIAPKSTHPELRFDLQNGIALCSTCHDGANNPNAVHAILRTDPAKYEMLMKELMQKRMSLC